MGAVVRLVTGRQPPLSILLTNLLLAGRTGTEIVTRRLAGALRDLGHQPAVYTPTPGALADELRAMSVPVISDIRDLRGAVDVIHGHHLPTTVAALARWPHTPALSVCHDFVAWHDEPPMFPSVRRYVAVDDTVAGRLRTAGVDEARLRIVLNQPDLDRFVPGPPLPERPRRALAFAKHREHLDAVRSACAARGLHLDVVGAAVNQLVEQPERLLPRYDLIFTSALSALEAMAAGRGVVVCDGRGLAGWVSPERFTAWRPLNFGLGALRGALTADDIGREIDRYAPADAARVCTQVRAGGGVRAHADAYVALYRELLAEPATWQDDVEARHTAMAAYVQQWSPGEATQAAWRRERAHLLEQTAHLLDLARITFGTTYAWSDPSIDRVVHTLDGFAAPEPWGRWTDGSSAAIALHLPRLAGVEQVLVHLRVVPFVTPEHVRQRMTLLVNGRPVHAWEFHHSDPEPVRAVCHSIPVEDLVGTGRLCLRFDLPDAVVPASISESPDPRRLGISLVDLRVERYPDTSAS